MSTDNAPGDSSRERLLAAAMAMLDANGEAGVRVDTVADMAGITKPSLYHFFGDRDGLVAAAQAERYRRSMLFGMEAQAEATRRCTSRAEFRRLVRGWTEAISSEQGMDRRRVRVQVLGSAVSRPGLRARIAEVDADAARQLAELVNFAKSNGWVSMTFDAEVAALWWYGMITGRFLAEAERPGGSLIRREWDAVCTEVVQRLLFGETPPDDE
ncbi:MAG: TetR/AcrR family transcriptional regulator [Ilumatobacteraceae bacterium]